MDSGFAPNRFDQEDLAQAPSASLRGNAADAFASLEPRLVNLGIWIQRVAYQPIALWWAAEQARLHPHVQQHIEFTLRQYPDRWPANVRRGWRLLFAAWADRRNDPNMVRYDVEAKAKQEGWSASLTRELAGIYRPRLKVDRYFRSHPLLWGAAIPDDVIRADVEYPHPHQGLQIPDAQIPYAASLFRQNLELAISLEREITGNDHLNFETSRADDGQPELNDDSYGLTGPIIYFQKLMQRWAHLDPTSARAEVFAWSTVDQYVFARLRIWAASREFLAPAEAADIFLGLPDIVFWGSQHERDLLYSLRDRWGEFSIDTRLALEDRLRTGAYPWSAETRGGVERAIAHDRLNRLHWLSRHGILFSFDLKDEMASLKVAAPDWITRWGDEAADSRAPVVRTIATDECADPLLEVPIADILAKAQSIGQYDFLEGVQREPFPGLASRRPSRALGALTHVGRKGEAPRQAWSDFLHAESRAKDSLRMIRTIAARLERLPIERLRDIAYPVTEWMVGIADRLYDDAAEALSRLWDRLIQALVLWGPDRRHRPDRSWADDALNSPVGRLVDLLLKDPAKNNLEAGAGYPAYWKARIDKLLALPGDLRCQALVMINFQLVWLFAIDPAWTERQILLCADDPGDDGDAFWEGVFWSARIPSRELFLRLKSGLAVRATEPLLRSSHESKNVIAGFLLAGWGGAADADPPDRLITDVEFREILIHTDNELREAVIWSLERWSTAANGRWRERVIPFLKNVWPKQRALRTPRISARLADFALANGNLMPAIVKVILPWLVPVRGGHLHTLSLKDDAGDCPARLYPKATLDLFWAVLAEDPRQWPYKIEDVIEILTETPETAADPRLSELRRRRER